ncbi:class I SAM-dependent methyltransferase [Arthrobacter sp. HLT1-20]
MSASWLEPFIAPGRALRRVDGGLLSALEADDPGSPYDGRAALYDRVIGSRLYNRLVWGSSPRSYATFAATAAASGHGPLLDVGCGSAVFTAAVYTSTDRPLILLDRSLGMLGRAAQRLGTGGSGADGVAFMQADLFDLPFAPQQFQTVASFGMLHLFDDLTNTLDVLKSQVSPGGSLYATSLVGETARGRRTLALLHRTGEVAAPRTEHELAAAAHQVLGPASSIHRQGSMAFLSWSS